MPVCAYCVSKITQGPSIHQLYSVFSFFLRLCKNVIRALSTRQEGSSVVICLKLITMLANWPSGLAKMIGGREYGRGSEGEMER